MALEGKRSLRSWSSRLERGAVLVVDASFPVAACLAATLIYALLAADLNPRARGLVEVLSGAVILYAVARRMLAAYSERDLSGYVRRHRFGATLALVALIWPLALLATATADALLDTPRLAAAVDSVSALLRLLLLVDLFSTAFYALLVFLARHLHVPPPLLIVVSFAVVIGVGTLFLMSPRATPPDRPISFLDALFTSTSATCVTGLAVRDTGTEFTPFGHAVLLVLIQVGGLGLMTFASFFSMFLGQGLGIKEGLVLRDALNLESLSRARPLLVFILKATCVIELSGAVAIYIALGPYWRPELSLWERAWCSLFHSVSAFCNAGFSTFPRELVVEGASLEAFRASWAVLSIFGLLIILGGLGFMVMLGFVDPGERERGPRGPLNRARRRLGWGLKAMLPRQLRRFLKRAYRSAPGRPMAAPAPRRPHRRVSVHTVLVLWTTALLLVGGFVGILLFEAGGPLFARQSPSEAAATAFFQSITVRTAGFNSVPYGATASFTCHADEQPVSTLVGNRGAGDAIRCPRCEALHVLTADELQAGVSDATLFLMISLMFVGASPGSTGGGAKTVTVALLFLAVLSILRKRDDIEIRDRSLAPAAVRNATAVVVLAFLVVTAVTMTLAWSERGMGPGGGDWRFIDLLFESVSAVATVGLSTGVTGSLSTLGRCVIVAAMFFGRIGPLTLVLSLAVSREAEPRRYKYPRTSVMIG